MGKILFSDVDGTLFEKGNLISDKNIEMMKKMQENGHLVALCTGRNHIDIQPVLEKFNIPYDYLVLCNGSYIEDKNGTIVFEEHIPKELGTDVVKFIIESNDYVVAFCSDEHCPALMEGKTKNLGVMGFEDTDLDFMELLENSDRFFMISTFHNEMSIDKVKELASEISTKFEGVDTHLNQQYIDIAPIGHSKGTGVTRLVSLLDDLDGIFAIGDSYNDLSMITLPDVVGATFTYANQDIQDNANEVVDFVHELIEKHIL